MIQNRRLGPPARLRTVLLFVLWSMTFAFVPAPAQAQGPTPREYQIKAVFLFNFLQFVKWPPEAFPEPDTPLRIGVLGEDPFGSALDEVVRDETVRDRPLVVQRSRRLEDLQDCHLLFISRSESRRIEEILSQLRGRPVLTVSEIDGFARQGGVIAFYPEGKKVRFEINADAGRHAELKLSSQLLSLGRVIGQQTAGGT